MNKASLKKTAIIVLGGALIKKKAGWSTTNFNEKGDIFGIMGDRLRVLAAEAIFYFLKELKCKVFIIASGGKGQYRNNPDIPFLSAVIKKELAGAGISQGLILEERNSGNTYEQLKESIKILKKRNIGDVLIVSNRYHLPRIKAFILTNSEFKNFYGDNPMVISAEEILMALDPKKWRPLIARIYKSKKMKERLALEQKGVKQIKNGTYDFGRKLQNKNY